MIASWLTLKLNSATCGAFTSRLKLQLKGFTAFVACAELNYCTDSTGMRCFHAFQHRRQLQDTCFISHVVTMMSLSCLCSRFLIRHAVAQLSSSCLCSCRCANLSDPLCNQGQTSSLRILMVGISTLWTGSGDSCGLGTTTGAGLPTRMCGRVTLQTSA